MCKDSTGNKILPFSYPVADQDCLVIDGGGIAAREAELRLKDGARVRVVSPEIGDQLREMALRLPLLYEHRPFVEGHLESVACVIVASGNETLNLEVSRPAR